MPSAMEFWLFLPQMRLSMDQLVARGPRRGGGRLRRRRRHGPSDPAAGGEPAHVRGDDHQHLARQPKTHTLRVGSLVLCDSFRHPAVLDREAVTLTHASGGRFELGIGWGSVADELGTFGVGSTEAKVRLGRLRESLEIIHALWTGEPLDYEGEHFTMHGAQQVPGPVGHIPIVIGGAGKGTMRLVAEHADWWNVHTHIVDKLDEMRHLAGKARCSLQAQVAFRGGPRRTRGDRGDGPAAFRGDTSRGHRTRVGRLFRLAPGSRCGAGLPRGSATLPTRTPWLPSARVSSASSTRRRH